ncbi:MAG TPA: pyridoxal phosphate-dependent aminotransferase [Candidatus Pelagibacter bacterium]|jgi:aspartate aminotransferase|nr:pyridoxal phosphate-dependent aminotransferase [Candidatus Pelagibacter bacterium]|tara:strand:- start:600 stop:1826 length:1227 start_codon:yes stop_codon:yes gene_type:complete
MIKNKIKNLDLSTTLKINEISKKLEQEGKEIIKFGFGQSPFPVPVKVVDELKKNAHQKSYLAIQGLYDLRVAISKYESKKKKNNFSSEQIIIGPGSKELMFLLHVSFDGDIILPAPSWVSYKPQSIIADNKFHWIQTIAENNWYPTAESLEELVLKNKEKNYLLILNSPNNPSGQVCKNIKEISEIVKKYKIIVLSDEIYSELTFDENYESISNYCSEQVIVSNGLSKWCGAGGWRLGYFVIPNELSKLKNSIKVLASETFSAVSAPIQFAAISAFNNDHTDYILKSIKILKGIGEYVYNNLKSNNVIMNKPMGGFYLMPEFMNKKFKTSDEMCTEILNKKGVAILPGSDFGFPKDKMITRLSYTDFDGKKFMSEINLETNINEEIIKNFAPKIIEGTKKLKDWAEIT